MELVLGIDLGTSYFKLGLFDRAGTLRGLGRVPVEILTGDGTRCELPVERFWSLLRSGLTDALAAADAEASAIVAVSYSSQANSFLLLDAHDAPLTPLVLWPDRRVNAVDDAVKALWARDDFLAHTGMGLPVSPLLAIAKMRWFQTQCPDLWMKMRHTMTISDYLTFSLTGRRVGDAGTAALLGVLDVERCCRWPDALETIGLAAKQLSAPLRPGASAGRVTQDGSLLLGLVPGIPMAVGSLDHHVAALGAGVGAQASCSESTGTVLACVRDSDRYRPVAGIVNGPGFGDGLFYQLAFDENGGGVLEWYQREHASAYSFKDLDTLAAAVPAHCDGLLAKPSAHSYEGLRGFENRREHHTVGHFARAIMTSVNQTLHRLLNALYPETFPSGLLATGGGSASDFWLKLKADMLGCEVIRTSCDEPACKGAAIIASTAAGWFECIDQACKHWVQIDRTFKPQVEKG